MHKKFEINQTKIKGGCQSGRKVATHNSKSDLPLVCNTYEKHTRKMNVIKRFLCVIRVVNERDCLSLSQPLPATRPSSISPMTNGSEFDEISPPMNDNVFLCPTIIIQLKYS